MQVSQPPSTPLDPVLDESDTWRDHWLAQRQPWRTEPEIDAARQAELRQALKASVPDIEQGRYPFRDHIDALDRADIEWLLARHAEDETQPGLDLRGADLRKTRLKDLPLAGVQGGLTADEWDLATDKQRELAAVRLEGADLRGAHLEGAIRCGAHLEGADLRGAHLEGAILCGAHLAGANLCGAHLEGTNLREAHLEGKENFPKPADLRTSFLSKTTRLDDIIMGNLRYGFAPLADIHWGNADLSVVDWSQLPKSGDEYAILWKLPVEYLAAIRANRQLALELRAQGLNEDADHFIYRTHVNQRLVLPQRALLPVVMRVFVRERMPLPKVLLRLDERRVGLRPPQHPVRLALFHVLPMLLLFLLVAIVQPLVLVLLLVLCIGLALSILPVLRKRGRHPPEYQRAQSFLPPPGLLSQQQRRRQQWLLLLAFLAGTPRAQLLSLLQSPQAALHQVPFIERLDRRQPRLATIVSALLVLLLLIDDTLLCYGRYVFASLSAMLSGYGYRLARTFSCYAIVVLGCSLLYAILGHQGPVEAFVSSLTAFHGRGLFSGNSIFSSNPTLVLGVVESIVGLIIELTFIATFARRLLGK